MKILKFEGYSDDTFGEYGHTQVDHDNSANGRPIVFEVKSKSENCYFWVVGHYGPAFTPGCWSVGIQVEEDVPLPDWKTKYITGVCPYSPTLCIEAPDDVTVKLWVEGEEPVESDNE